MSTGTSKKRKHPPKNTRAGTSVSEPSEWSPPSIEAKDFKQRIGSSVLEQFVAGHDPMDVLRELVQNEFDAGGTKMSVVFSDAGMMIAGTGKSIDKKGWARLGVILGTGSVVGADAPTVIVPKENGIGSKNFGLRSLFLFGNRIFVRSNGRMAVMDLPAMGSVHKDDPSSAGHPGVTIFVPFRTERINTLAIFDAGHERQAMNEMAGALFGTLAKLSLTGNRDGIRQLTITSERTRRRLAWTQTAKAVACRLKGVSAIHRFGRLVDQDASRPNTNKTTTFEEIEFFRPVEVPADRAVPPYPGYYRARGRNVTIAVSLPIRRRRIDQSQPGYFHYPLRAPKGSTGLTLSASAPFELDADRSELVSSDWNSWLADEAASLAMDLLLGDWDYRFGVDAFLALQPSGMPDRPWFANAIQAALRERPCWPTEEKAKWAKVADLVVATDPQLRGFLGMNRDLRADLGDDTAIRDLAVLSGAKSFGANSLVRLRCAGGDKSRLVTKIGVGEADFHYPDYRGNLTNIDRQISLANALDTISKRLSNLNRTDLRQTPSTLAADGTLKAAATLVTVDADIWEVCPVPLASRLHPGLRGLRSVAGICQSFDMNQWIIDVAARARDGAATEEDRAALYVHLLTASEAIGRTALRAIRRSPVVKDANGQWKSPDTLALLPAEISSVLGKVVDAPSAEIAKNSALTTRLAIRRRLSVRDIVALASSVADNPSDAQACEELCAKQIRLLTPKIVGQLQSIPFLRSKSGGIASPQSLHLDLTINTSSLDSDSLIVAGKNVGLYRTLGCRSYPSFQVLLDVLIRLKDAGTGPVKPEVIYPAMAMAAAQEKKQLSVYRDEPFLWVSGDYRTPAKTLVGALIPRFLEIAVPVIRASRLVEEAFEELGAHRFPTDGHWEDFFRWFGSRSTPGTPLSRQECHILRQAYARRGSAELPDGIADNVRCFLARTGTLHSLREIRNAELLEDDFPQLAAALTIAGGCVAFADLSENGGQFFAASGLKRLTEVCGNPEVTMGALASRPPWFHESHEKQILQLMHLPDFAVALQELAWARERQVESFGAMRRLQIERRLGKIQAIVFVADIASHYTVNDASASVQTEWALAETRICLRPSRSKFEFHQAIAHVLAELVGAMRLADNRALAAAIFPLLSCGTNADMQSYLLKQGIQPSRWSNSEIEDDSIDQEPMTEAEMAAAKIFSDLAGGLNIKSAPAPPATTPPLPTIPLVQPVAPKPAPALPPLDQVTLSVSKRSGDEIALPGSRTSGGGGYSGYWTPPTSQDVERDRAIGIRGEELVYLMEIERVRALGHENPEEKVIWTSRVDPGADHDIRSIAADGKPLWIEVKSTTGSDGRFEWPRREFEKAFREGKHYELWRVYEAGTEKPVAKTFANPVALLRDSRLRLELATLRAYVETK